MFIKPFDQSSHSVVPDLNNAAVKAPSNPRPLGMEATESLSATNAYLYVIPFTRWLLVSNFTRKELLAIAKITIF